MEKASDSVVRVGPAGWSYPDWNGIVYPPRMPKDLHPLSLLCEHFDTVEINSSFYRPPNPRHCESWVEKVAENPHFKFTAKLWERFSHKRTTELSQEDIEVYRAGIEPLHDAGKLVLIQNAPDKYMQAQSLALQEEMDKKTAEFEVFGATHGAVGGYLLGLWGLNDRVVEAVAFHQRPGSLPQKVFSPLTAIHIADALDKADPDQTLASPESPLDIDYIHKLGLEERLDAWQNLYATYGGATNQ